MKGLFQRDGILFGRGLLPALVLTLLVGFVCFLAGYSIAKSVEAEESLVSVALVNEDESNLGLVAVDMVKETTFMKDVLSMQDYDRESALEAFHRGELEAVIILPDGYVDQVAHGIPGKGLVYLSKGAVSSGEILRSIVTFGELMLVAGQQGVFLGEDMLQLHGISGKVYDEFLKKSNTTLLNSAFTLFDVATDVTELPVSDYAGSGLPLLSSYVVLWLGFFFLLSGLFFVPLYTSDIRKGLLTRLYGGGVRPIGFLAGKLVYPFLYRLVLAVPLFLVLANTFSYVTGGAEILSVLLGLVLATVFTTASAVLLSERKGWPAMLTGIFTVSLLLAGGIVPRPYLPEAVTEVSRFLPVGMLYSCFAPLFGGRADPLSVLAGSVLALVLLAGALIFLKRFPEKGEGA